MRDDRASNTFRAVEAIARPRSTVKPTARSAAFASGRAGVIVVVDDEHSRSDADPRSLAQETTTVRDAPPPLRSGTYSVAQRHAASPAIFLTAASSIVGLERLDHPALRARGCSRALDEVGAAFRREHDASAATADDVLCDLSAIEHRRARSSFGMFTSQMASDRMRDGLPDGGGALRHAVLGLDDVVAGLV